MTGSSGDYDTCEMTEYLASLVAQDSVYIQQSSTGAASHGAELRQFLLGRGAPVRSLTPSHSEFQQQNPTGAGRPSEVPGQIPTGVRRPR
jgi:hypothetical protein